MNDAAGVFCCPLCFLTLENRDLWRRHRAACHAADKWLDSVKPKPKAD